MHVKTLVLGPLSTNCYLLTSDSAPGHALIIDPAFHPESILKELEKEELVLDAILLTHCHFDHMWALDELAENTGALLLCPEKDKKGLTDPKQNASSLFFRTPLSIKTTPARLLKDSDQILLGNEKLTVLETPGHTAGSVCYKTEDLLFSGDTLFQNGSGRTDLPSGDGKAMERSLRCLLAFDDLTVYPGHGKATSIGKEKAFFEI